MKKLTGLFFTFLFLLPAGLQAKTDYIWRQRNNPANYVKLIGISGSEAETMKLNQPYNFTEGQIADFLRSLRYNRRSLFTDKVQSRKVFEEEYIEKYTPLLVKAFKEASPEQMVYMSVAQKRPWYIVRNDRLTQITLWVTGQELHIRFNKTEAKLAGDYQANSQEGRKLRRNAKGLRISLEPQEGQKFAFNSSKELILDINSDWEAIVTKIEAEEERIAQEEAIRKAKGSRKKKLQAEAKQSTAPPPISPKDQKTAEERLTELKKLKDKGLIDQKDYDKKKEEILQNM